MNDKSALQLRDEFASTRKHSVSAFFNLRVLIGLFVFLAGIFLVLFGFGTFSNAFAQTQGTKPGPNAAPDQRAVVGSRLTGENFWASTHGPQGGDVLALATNASGYVF